MSGNNFIPDRRTAQEDANYKRVVRIGIAVKAQSTCYEEMRDKVTEAVRNQYIDISDADLNHAIVYVHEKGASSYQDSSERKLEKCITDRFNIIAQDLTQTFKTVFKDLDLLSKKMDTVAQRLTELEATVAEPIDSSELVNTLTDEFQAAMEVVTERLDKLDGTGEDSLMDDIIEELRAPEPRKMASKPSSRMPVVEPSVTPVKSPQGSAGRGTVDRGRMAELFEQGLDYEQIAGHLGCSHHTVRHYLSDMGLTRKHRKADYDLTKMLALKKQGWTNREIASELGISQATVSQQCNRYGLGGKGARYKVDQNRLTELREQGWTHEQLGSEFGVSGSYISKLLTELGMGVPRIEVDLEEAARHLGMGFNRTETAERMGVPAHVLNKALRKAKQRAGSQ